jgi:hypothetical protein
MKPIAYRTIEAPKAKAYRAAPPPNALTLAAQ